MKNDQPAILFLFGMALCFSLGAAGCLVAALVASRAQDDTQLWVPVRGVVTDASVEARNVGRSTAFYPAVRYSYEVGGRSFEGRRLTFCEDDVEFGGTEPARAELRGLEKGSEVTVFHDPASPADSTLRKGRPSAAGGLAAAAGGLLVPAALFWFLGFTVRAAPGKQRRES